jgi:hypothetical protein
VKFGLSQPLSFSYSKRKFVFEVSQTKVTRISDHNFVLFCNFFCNIRNWHL